MGYKFNPEIYIKPITIEETSEALIKYDKAARIIAGGTDLLVDRPEKAKVLIDINGLNLCYIHGSEKGVRIGSTTTLKMLHESLLLQKPPYKMVSNAALELGHYNLRNIATVGGNICNAVPSADTPIALIALDTNTVIAGLKGERTAPLHEFYRFVRKTTLSSGEFLKEVVIPPQPKYSTASFQKIGRTKIDIAIVNVACRITLRDGVVDNSRIILGAVAPIPIRAFDAENQLNGNEISHEILERVVKIAAETARPIDDLRSSAQYRHEMIKVLTRRAIMDAYKKTLEVSG
jgi:carbon-monoxide dehydrogenase medium subunit